MAAITEELFNGLKPEQQKNLLKLLDLADKEKIACDKVNELFRRGSYLEDGAVVVCENMDDLTVINAFKPKEKQHPFYRQLIDVKSQIKQTLEESLKLDLGYLRLVQKQCKNYGVEIGNGKE